MVKSWLTSTFSEHVSPTIGAAFVKSTFEYRGLERNIQIWDTAGEEQYRSVTSVYCRDAFAAMIVYDKCNRASFENIPYWIGLISKQGPIPIVVCGNKNDLHSDTEITLQEAAEFCAAYNVSHFFTSARTQFGIFDAFTQLLDLAFERQKSLPKDDLFTGVQATPEPQPKKQCCF
ncbi:Ras family protein [Trichomonas vaginalis G3]|uniref:Ras family protein n=1 Tax=Trichomonas vaginalis (strain ATCC PRA-98 / G3) TaxID=412133 RepID=A2E0I6_TRIV3|nr:GTPase protein [Trichomonas vaginalis G3]EAY13866.1 Ras family protein [Trichomonas vaginalis G3]KAI5520432.1 GTPase protein [Trichomonas vaginalis G3]|eukprot:XP_001326089.1 Ras family protein [Trichomonas vaginalis G3]